MTLPKPQFPKPRPLTDLEAAELAHDVLARAQEALRVSASFRSPDAGHRVGSMPTWALTGTAVRFPKNRAVPGLRVEFAIIGGCLLICATAWVVQQFA